MKLLGDFIKHVKLHGLTCSWRQVIPSSKSEQTKPFLKKRKFMLNSRHWLVQAYMCVHMCTLTHTTKLILSDGSLQFKQSWSRFFCVQDLIKLFCCCCRCCFLCIAVVTPSVKKKNMLRKTSIFMRLRTKDQEVIDNFSYLVCIDKFEDKIND